MKQGFTWLRQAFLLGFVFSLPMFALAQTWDYDKYVEPPTSNGKVVVSQTPKQYVETHTIQGAHVKTVGVPDDYYSSCMGFSGETLRERLHTVISTGAKKLYYTSSEPDVWDMCRAGDESPVDPTAVWLIYTEISRDKDEQQTGGSGTGKWNREHVWAKSHGDFGTDPGPGTDGHHLRAADSNENTERSYYNFDYVSTGPGTASGGYYEPPLSSKGDVARMIFYMAVRWEGEDGYPDLEVIEAAGGSNNPTHGKWSTLLEWHELDPVDPYEIRRNNTIYGFQHNRNPFVDHPELVHLIFGADTNMSWDGGPSFATTPNISLYGSLTEFPMIKFGETSAVQSYEVSGLRLTGDVTVTAPEHFQVSLTENDADFKSTLTLSPAGAELDKTTVYVRFRPESAFDGQTTAYISHTTAGGSERKQTVVGTEGDPSLQPETIYVQDFETNCATDWEKVSYSSTDNWECTDPANNYGNGGGIAIAINNYQNGEVSNDWLVSPEFDLATYNKLSLHYWERTLYSGSVVTLKYSTNYTGDGNPKAATWTDLKTLDMYGAWTETEVDINAIAANGLYFAFVHTTANGTNSHIVNFDDFSIEGYNTGKQNQTITITGVEDKKVDADPFVVTASSTSNLAVSLSVESGPASIVAGTVTLDGTPGTVVIKATQDGDDTYAAASATASFEVSKYDQSITFDALDDKQADAADFDVAASTTATGLAVTISLVSGPATINGNTVSLTGETGTVVLEATQAGDATYNAATAVQQSFNVTKIDQTITFDAIEDKLTTDDPFTISATATSGLTVSFAVVSGPATVSGNIVSLSGTVGTVTIEATQAGDATYNAATAQQQIFEVTGQVSGIEEQIGFSVSPNPALHFVNIAGNISPNAQISIFTITGKHVLSETLGSDKSIEVEGLEKGIYLLKVQDGDISITEKISIQ